MMPESILAEIKSRLESQDGAIQADRLIQDASALAAEVQRLHHYIREFTARVDANLNEIERDMARLEGENERLKKVRDSTYFERDACIGLLAQMASQLGLPAGTMRGEVFQENMDGSKEIQLQNRVVIDLPSGQVSWDYLDEDAHLFEMLPAYGQPLLEQSVREVYTKVMNPGLGPSLGGTS